MTGELLDSLEDMVAGLSSASACINITVLGVSVISFKPVYTHQCFEGEFIPGYEPSLTDTENALLIAS